MQHVAAQLHGGGHLIDVFPTEPGERMERSVISVSGLRMAAVTESMNGCC
jgi:hypothetical protein